MSLDATGDEADAIGSEHFDLDAFDALAETPRARALRAAVACFGRWGTTKTTLDDVARESAISRATLYRLFPGGKPALVEAVGEREVGALLWQVHDVLVRSATLDELLIDALVTTTRAIRHHAALNHVLAHEPEVLLPVLSFEGFNHLLAGVVEFCRPSLERFVDHDLAGELAEWGTRLLVSSLVAPVPFDLTRREDAERLVRTHVLPGVAAASPAAALT